MHRTALALKIEWSVIMPSSCKPAAPNHPKSFLSCLQTRTQRLLMIMNRHPRGAGLPLRFKIWYVVYIPPHRPIFSQYTMHFRLPRVKSFTNIVEQVRDAMKHKHEKESEAHQVCSSPSQPSILTNNFPPDIPTCCWTQAQRRSPTDYQPSKPMTSSAVDDR
jgi:hypothetical protein